MALGNVIVGIHQPNYLPWLGYFRKIALSDTFVFFDNVIMPGGKSFTSRNAIKTPQGRNWLTVPVSGKGNKKIAEVDITDQHWRRKHLRTIEVNYRPAPHFTDVFGAIEDAMQQDFEFLADQNIFLIQLLSGVLGLDHVNFVRADCMELNAEGADSIEPIIKILGANVYVTGHGAGSMRHLDMERLLDTGVETKFVSSEFEPYPQLHGEFIENLSIIDALFNLGIAATRALLLPASPEQLLSTVAAQSEP